MRNSFVTHPKRCAGLCAGGDMQSCTTGQRGHFHIGAERRVDKRNRQVENNVVSFAMKMLMRFLGNEYKYIAAATAASSDLPLPLQGNIISFTDTGWHVDLDRRLTLNTSFAVACSALVLHHRSFTVTGRTDTDIHHLPEHRTRHLPQLT